MRGEFPAMAMEAAKILATEFKIQSWQAEAVIRLLDEGNTLPFIARYRKEQHGELDDQKLREIAERLAQLRALEARRAAGAVARAGSPARRDRRLVAKAGSVDGGIAARVGRGGHDGRAGGHLPALPPQAPHARDDRPGEGPGTAVRHFAIAGGKAQVARRVGRALSQRRKGCARVRAKLKALYLRTAQVRTRAAKEEDSVYRMYYEHQEPMRLMASHRVLAVNRGEAEGFLKVSLEVDAQQAENEVCALYVRPGSTTTPLVEAAARDAYSRLIAPSLENELRGDLTERAQEAAIRVFALNLKPLLMQPPVRGKVAMGLDPGIRTGCKVAVVDATGRVLDTGVIYPLPSHGKVEQAKKTVEALIRKHGVSVVAIGNGTASRETEQFFVDVMREMSLGSGLSYMVVSEAGASVYSASKLAAEEFPQFDVSLRSAVSIARRLQDPLAELVKIDPKAIGVGQYQHDLKEARLDEALAGVVEDCVNAVGVDVNTASTSLLSHVAGINAAVAKNIVAYREENGAFASRAALKKVPKLGPKAFEQCAGFLRVPGGKDPMENTGVHPESYAAAKALLRLCGCSLEDAQKGLLRLKAEERGYKNLAEQTGAGEPTLRDIVKELEKPGRDPRDELPPPLLRTDVLDMDDLTEGMELKGTVRNVTDFGAFVDIGVHRDGLVRWCTFRSFLAGACAIPAKWFRWAMW